MLPNTLENLNPHHRVGIVISLEQDPYDRDFRQVKVYQRIIGRGRNSDREFVNTIRITARNAQRKSIVTGAIIKWDVFQNAHIVSDDDLRKLDLDVDELISSYRKWVEVESKLNASV